jgi:hypothetical protein
MRVGSGGGDGDGDGAAFEGQPKGSVRKFRAGRSNAETGRREREAGGRTCNGKELRVGAKGELRLVAEEAPVEAMLQKTKNRNVSGKSP